MDKVCSARRDRRQTRHPQARRAAPNGAGTGKGKGRDEAAEAKADAESKASIEAERQRMQKRLADKGDAERVRGEEARKAAEATLDQARQQAQMAKQVVATPLVIQ